MMKLNKLLLAVGGFLVVGQALATNQPVTTTSGGTVGQIVIQGTVASNTTINLYDDDVVTSLSGLKTTALTDVNIGQVVIDTSNPSGFSLKLQDANGGKLFHSTGGGANKQIPFDLDLVLQGSAPSGWTLPTMSNLAAGLAGAGTASNFTCASTCAPATITYDINIDIPVIASAVLSGSYADTVTLTVADI